MQVLERLLLCILSLAKLLNKVLLNALELTHFIGNTIYLLLSSLFFLGVLPGDFFLLLGACECFILQELKLMLFYLCRSVPLGFKLITFAH